MCFSADPFDFVVLLLNILDIKINVDFSVSLGSFQLLFL